jgi:hypothetical protein
MSNKIIAHNQQNDNGMSSNEYNKA